MSYIDSLKHRRQGKSIFREEAFIENLKVMDKKNVAEGDTDPLLYYMYKMYFKAEVITPNVAAIERMSNFEDKSYSQLLSAKNKVARMLENPHWWINDGDATSEWGEYIAMKSLVTKVTSYRFYDGFKECQMLLKERFCQEDDTESLVNQHMKLIADMMLEKLKGNLEENVDWYRSLS